MTAFRPTLDFFEGQRLARQRTTLLVLAFGLALIAVTALVYLALVVGVVFRFIPLLYGEAARISVARMVRQGRAAKRAARNPVARALAAVPLFVPLVIRTLVRAERLAEAIAARYYGTGRRTRYLDRPVRPIEIALAVLLVASVVAFAVVSRSFGVLP